MRLRTQEPPKTKLRCRLIGHSPVWWAVDIGRARWGRCVRCALPLVQSRWHKGPILVDWQPPCTHSVSDRPIPACMQCALEAEWLGLP